jgi:FkbM family methyltransferase
MSLLKVTARKFNTLKKMLSFTGIKGAVMLAPLPDGILLVLSKLGIELKGKPIKLNLTGYEHPVYMRYATSDIAMFHQIFIFREYSCIDELAEPRFIIDAGANVGYASIYFLNKYPTVRIVAVEPDEDNFSICQANLSGYDDRILVIKSGVWSHEAALKVCNEDGREKCSVQVKECMVGETPDIYAVDIDSILEKGNFPTIDLLKMDIEGSETVVFSKNYQNWLPKVKNIVIELHGPECDRALFEALDSYDYDLSTYGELTVCQQLSSKVLQENSVNSII